MLINNIKFQKGEVEPKILSEYIREMNLSLRTCGSNLYIDNGSGYLIQKGQTVTRKIANFFVIHMGSKIINKYYTKEHFLYLYAISYVNKEVIKIMLNEKELQDEKWISDYLDTKNYSIYGNYSLLKKAIVVSKNIMDLEVKYYDDYKGWITNIQKYILSEYSYKWLEEKRQKESESYGSVQIFKESQDFFNVAPKEITVAIFSYCLLALINELLRDLRMEPNFVLQLIGNKSAYVMQLAELFSNNMNPDKGSILYNSTIKENMLPNVDAQYCYVFGDYSIIKEKIADCKDRTIIIDGLMKGSQKQISIIYEKLLVNYSIKNQLNKLWTDNERKKLNALPILIVDTPIDNSLYLKVQLGEKSVKPSKLIELRKKEYVLTALVLDIIPWIEKGMLDNRTIYKEIRLYYYEYKRQVFYRSARLTERQVEIYAWLLCAFKLYIQFGLDIQAISVEASDAMLNEVFKALTGVYNNDSSAFSNYEEVSAETKLEKEKMLYQILVVIEHIYHNEKDKLTSEREALAKGKIGWVGENKKEKLLCFKPEDLNGYLTYYAERVNINSNIDFYKVKDIINNKGLLKVHEREFRYRLCKSPGKPRVIAFRIDRVIEYLKQANKV